MSILTNAWKLLLTLMISVQHDSRDENTLVSDLLQQALGFQSNRGKFSFLKKTGCSGLSNQTVRFLADAQCNSLFW
jgi:hypothetical protein